MPAWPSWLAFGLPQILPQGKEAAPLSTQALPRLRSMLWQKQVSIHRAGTSHRERNAWGGAQEDNSTITCVQWADHMLCDLKQVIHSLNLSSSPLENRCDNPYYLGFLGVLSKKACKNRSCYYVQQAPAIPPDSCLHLRPE